MAERSTQATMAHARLQRDALESIDKAWAARTITRTRITDLTRQLEADRKTIAAFNKEYELGQRSLIDLLNAQNQYFNAAVSLTSARGVVVFADYPLLFWPGGVVPLAREDGWVSRLEDAKACLVTLDHFGFAQEAMEFFLGPPHLVNTHYQLGPIPSRMKIMLPCPMHEPLPVAGRKGRSFRYLDAAAALPAASAEVTR